MPPRPFPLPFRVGTDVVHVPRIKALITKAAPAIGKAKTAKASKTAPLDSFLQRVFTPHEQALFWKRFQNADHVLSRNLDSVSNYLAGRFAAKEAAIKAVRHRRITYRQVEIRRTEPSAPQAQGYPYAVILDAPSDEAAVRSSATPADLPAQGEAPDDDAPGQIVDVSISHDGEYATAVCIAPEQPWEGDVGGELAARMP